MSRVAQVIGDLDRCCDSMETAGVQADTVSLAKISQSLIDINITLAAMYDRQCQIEPGNINAARVAMGLEPVKEIKPTELKKNLQKPRFPIGTWVRTTGGLGPYIVLSAKPCEYNLDIWEYKCKLVRAASEPEEVFWFKEHVLRKVED